MPAIFLLCSLSLTSHAQVLSGHHPCPDSNIGVVTGEPARLHDICAGAADALSFFADLDLTPSHPIVVEIVRHLPDHVSDSAIGCYLEDQERICVLDYDAFQRHEKWFGVPVSPSMYRSVVTHEVAHAVADYNFRVPKPTIQAKEYVAYVAMFASMDTALRERIMMEKPGSGFDSELKINATIYLCDPMRFGLEAYRHYLREDRGNAFLQKVLSGGALNE